MSNGDFGRSREPVERQGPPEPGRPGGWAFGPDPAGWPDEDGYLDNPELDDPELDDPGAMPYPLTYERDGFDPEPFPPAAAGQAAPWPTAPATAGAGAAPAAGAPYEPWLSSEPEGAWWDPHAASGRRRWLIPVGVAVAGAAISTAAVLLGSGHGGAAPAAVGRTTRPVSASPPASPAASPAVSRTAAPSPTAPPLTVAAARRALAAYTTGNNAANAARNDAELARIETGGSYAIDAGSYAIQRAANAKPFPAFAPVAATYYIPRSEPADGPRWFVVRVANAFSANPNKVTSTEYLLFTQAAPGRPWRNAVEPYLLTGAAAPQIALGGDGLATAVSLTAGSLAAAPGQLATRTAGSIDGVGGGVFVTSASPGLADRAEQRFWRGKLPGAKVHDAHAAAAGSAGQTFALRTTSGGALVFYADTAELTFTPPAGSTLRLDVPGLYSAAQALTSARLAYLDQFAAYDPPATAGAPTVIAAYSGITGKN